MTELQKSYTVRQTFLPVFSLFASMSTLICCALPALLVTLGAGAALAGLVSSAPWLIVLSKYKVWTFGVSGVVILFSGAVLWQARDVSCPIDPQQAKACMRLRSVSWWFYWGSVAVWCVGFFFAFIAIHVFY